MKLIVGFGNPGEKYVDNRHNIGFMCVEYLAYKLSSSPSVSNPFTFDKTFNAEIAVMHKDGEKIMLAKPQTFMNRSGEAVQKLLAFYKVRLQDMAVAHDDLDIPIGKCKIQIGTGPKIHNGLLSTEQKLGTADFCRIRLGIENRQSEDRMPGEAYVLQDFTPDERTLVNECFGVVYERLQYDFLRKVPR